MTDAAIVSKLARAAKFYTKDVGALVAAGSTTEATYYPAVKSLIAAGLAVEDLPFDVRINTSEQKAGGGVNLLAVALYEAEPLEDPGEIIGVPAVAQDQGDGDRLRILVGPKVLWRRS